jgi:septum formation protein
MHGLAQAFHAIWPRPSHSQGKHRMPRLILASTSFYRKSQLALLKIPFDAIAPDVDEDAFKAQNFSPRELALRLAIEKARAVAQIHPDAVVIGGDQLVSFQDQILGKPRTEENAIEQLSKLAGHPHDLITAVAVCHQGACETHVDETRLWMRPLDREALERYVRTDRPLDCAGSYKIESLGIALFERIETQDHTAITGLPLLAITRLLCAFGMVVP